MAEPKPEYAERLKREKIQADFLVDLQAVLNKWSAEIQGTCDGHFEVTVYSPLFDQPYNPDHPLVVFTDSYLAASTPPEKHLEPGEPRDWNQPTLESFVENNYWHGPEDAIGDIRLYITKHKQ